MAEFFFYIFMGPDEVKVHKKCKKNKKQNKTKKQEIEAISLTHVYWYFPLLGAASYMIWEQTWTDLNFLVMCGDVLDYLFIFINIP